MKTVSRAVVRFSLGLIILLCSVVADVSVKGHFRKDGTYVAPHTRSSPNSTTLDNWSTKGNVNPYTGQVGTKNPVDGVVPSTGSFPASGTVQSSSSYGGSTSPSPNELRSESSASTPKHLEIGSIQVGTGMTTVEWLLGKPERISDDGTGETWRYSNGAWVEFTASGYVYKAGGFDAKSPKTNQDASSSYIDKLTQRIVLLEAKVAELTAIIKNESQGSLSAFPSSNSSPTDANAQPPTIEQWRKIKHDDPNKIQTMNFIINMLGKPKSIEQSRHPFSDEPGEFWRYNGGGYVRFNRNGVLTGFGGYQF